MRENHAICVRVDNPITSIVLVNTCKSCRKKNENNKNYSENNHVSYSTKYAQNALSSSDSIIQPDTQLLFCCWLRCARISTTLNDICLHKKKKKKITSFYLD